MKRAALYIRVSTDEQARHGYSLDEQRHTLEGYAARNGYTIVDVYADEGATARKALKNRHELQRLLADVRAGLIDCILFIKLDRWFRNIRDFYTVQDILDQHGVKWIATQEDYNTTTSAGRLNLNIRLSIAQNESDQIGERIRFVYEGKKRRHEAVAGHLCIGYRVEDKHYVIDEPQAAIVRDIFSRYLFSQSVSDTQRYIAGKMGKPISTGRISRLLRNERYIGRWWGIDNYAPAIIEPAIFDRVQKLLAIGRRGSTPRQPTEPYLFSGLVFCPSCGNRLVGTKAGGRGHGRKYYMCRKHYHAMMCTFQKLIAELALESYLLDHLEPQANQYRHELEVQEKDSHNALVSIDNRIAAARARLNRLKDLYISAFIDRATYEKDYQTYNAELVQAQAEKRAAGGRQLSPQLQNIIDKGFISLYRELSAAGKKAFWKSIVYKLEITHYEPIYPDRKKSPLRLEVNIIFL